MTSLLQYIQVPEVVIIFFVVALFLLYFSSKNRQNFPTLSANKSKLNTIASYIIIFIPLGITALLVYIFAVLANLGLYASPETLAKEKILLPTTLASDVIMIVLSIVIIMYLKKKQVPTSKRILPAIFIPIISEILFLISVYYLY